MARQIVFFKLSFVTLMCVVALALLPVADIFRQIRFQILK